MAEAIQPTVVRRTPARTAARSQGRVLQQVLIYSIITLGAVASMLPFVWTFLSSGKDINELYRYPPTWWPEQMRFAQNYAEIFQVVPFARWFANTVYVTVLSLLGTIISATLVAYGFARFRFPGRDAFFFLTLSTIMLPVEVTLIPTYLLFKNFDWIDTYYPLIVPLWFGGGALTSF
jgi:multiple sugar transport system permease protein